ncbi:uncharacterized protein LOC108485156 [Gossypium arboreum]|uniref:uncharacterized protein LOC108485156 n=1 Tax=Gossypium arboreum TaxID=29729 RepID=UPI0022F1D1F0|nr:uncharacterized protein LOC108485156 [Gossypium arboreum]
MLSPQILFKYKKKPRADGAARVGTPAAANSGSQFCAGCGKCYQGECWKKMGAYLRCRSLEHHRGGQQPLRGGSQARGGNGMGHSRGAPGRGTGHTEARQSVLVYFAHRGEDGDAPDVISGTFFIYNVPYMVLIDVESTHSYVACSAYKILGIIVEHTMSEVTVPSLLRQSIWINKMFRDVLLEIKGVIFLADLMEFPFGEFDLILGMDWLEKHRVSLDCATKWVVLRTEADEEVVVIGERQNYLNVGDSSVRDIRTITDFPNVFLEELPGLPPEREVEFGIELLPGTALVSITPYRMAPKELVELKVQIQELLDRGFIQTSVSM